MLKSLRERTAVLSFLCLFVFGEPVLDLPNSSESANSVSVTAADVPAKQVRTPFELHDGDRVVLLGATFTERAQRYGWLETALQLRYPKRKLHIRNLGWSADTVLAESRGIFDAPAQGYSRMIEQVVGLRPTVILLEYGTNESFKGPKYLTTFLAQYEKLIADLSPTGAEIVLISPMPLLTMAPPLPDPQSHNRNREEYVAAIGKLSKRFGLKFVDMWAPIRKLAAQTPSESLSNDGVHFTESGYRVISELFADQLLGSIRPVVRLAIGADGVVAESDSVRIRNFSSNKNRIRFEVSVLPSIGNQGIDLTTTGLASGSYDIVINGKQVDQVETTRAGNGEVASATLRYSLHDAALRDAIIHKNMMYFHSWRPQNVTYLFLFRKHEQGNNAGEVDDLRKIVDGLDNSIAELKRHPGKLAVEIRRAD